MPPAAPAPAVWTREPGVLRARRPTANRAGSPAPASRPTTTICHRAVRLIQEFTFSPLSPSDPCGFWLGRSDRPGPLVVDIVRADRGLTGPQVDAAGDSDQDHEVHDHA